MIRRAVSMSSNASTPSEDHLAVGRLHQRGQHAEGAGLSRAVRPDQAEDFARRHAQREIIHGDEIAVVHAEIADVDRRRRARDHGRCRMRSRRDLQ